MTVEDQIKRLAPHHTEQFIAVTLGLPIEEVRLVTRTKKEEKKTYPPLDLPMPMLDKGASPTRPKCKPWRCPGCGANIRVIKCIACGISRTSTQPSHDE